MPSTSSRRGKQPGGSKNDTLIRRRHRGGRWYKVLADGTERLLPNKPADWSRLDAMSEEQILKAALADPDAQPMTKRQLAKMRRVSPAKRLRWKLGLSQAEFAERFRIPVGTLRDWEQHRTEPDQAALSYLRVIEADADFVARAVA